MSNSVESKLTGHTTLTMDWVGKHYTRVYRNTYPDATQDEIDTLVAKMVKAWRSEPDYDAATDTCTIDVITVEVPA